jgi:hypothetical protein
LHPVSNQEDSICQGWDSHASPDGIEKHEENSLAEYLKRSNPPSVNTPYIVAVKPTQTGKDVTDLTPQNQKPESKVEQPEGSTNLPGSSL